MLLPATPIASTSTGITMCRSTSATLPSRPGVVMPEEGSQPSRTVNR